MRIAVDVKNLALYHGGIAQFFAPLLAHWIAERAQHEFVLVGPPFDTAGLPPTPNWRHLPVAWPARLPRQARHPTYDNVLFPRALASCRPGFVFTPYHDVRLPRGVRSALMIHDTCLDELKAAYPRLLRAYYLHALERNLRRAAGVVTVSNASADRIRLRYGLAARALHIVPNACHPDFLAALREPPEVAAIRERLAGGRALVFYPGGAEFRKNVGALVAAFRHLGDDARLPALAITGERNAAWDTALAAAPAAVRSRIRFLGYLDQRALKQHYFAADAVVYPSLCEGFGRVCLESLVTGTPIACSDLPVMREVAGDAPYYFDPADPQDLADQLKRALAGGRRTPLADERYTPERARAQFLQAMDALCTA